MEILAANKALIHLNLNFFDTDIFQTPFLNLDCFESNFTAATWQSETT